jgi:hypothetical protein
VSDDKDTEYRVRSREKISIVAPRRADNERPRAFPTGSAPEIVVMPDLAPPGLSGQVVEFGRSSIVVEHYGDRVVLVLPGGQRLEGKLDEARQLIAALRAS